MDRRIAAHHDSSERVCHVKLRKRRQACRIPKFCRRKPSPMTILERIGVHRLAIHLKERPLRQAQPQSLSHKLLVRRVRQTQDGIVRESG